jgi:hypothetical protein
MGLLGMLTGRGGGYDLAGGMDVTTPFGPLKLPFNKSGTTGFTTK